MGRYRPPDLRPGKIRDNSQSYHRIEEAQEGD